MSKSLGLMGKIKSKGNLSFIAKGNPKMSLLPVVGGCCPDGVTGQSYQSHSLGLNAGLGLPEPCEKAAVGMS